MLCDFNESYRDVLKAKIKENRFKNIYLYIDANTYGFSAVNISTWIAKSENEIYAVLYKYYNSLQLLAFKPLNYEQVSEICENITQNGYDMISAEYDVLQGIAKNFDGLYTLTKGNVMSGEECRADDSGLSVKANENQCTRIAELICSDKSIGGHYTVEVLSAQLKERMKLFGCRNYIIQKDNKIISHMASYAEISDTGVLGGLVTSDGYRGMGYGRAVLNDITQSLIKDGKTPLLYCFKPDLIKWYKSQGWKTISVCGKLEKN